MARQYLERQGEKTGAGNEIHQTIVQILVTSGNARRLRLEKDLGRFRQLRNQADYDDEIENVAFLESVGTRLRDSIKAQIEALSD